LIYSLTSVVALIEIGLEGLERVVSWLREGMEKGGDGRGFRGRSKVKVEGEKELPPHKKVHTYGWMYIHTFHW